MKFPKLLYPSFLCLLIAGCDMIDYHPYDVHISGETDVNAHNIAQIEQNCQNKTTIRFVTMGDSQRWYDETDDFVSHLNKRDDSVMRRKKNWQTELLTLPWNSSNARQNVWHR